MGELDNQTTHLEVSLAKMAGFALALRLVVAGTGADRGSQAVCSAEGVHIGANLNQQHGGAYQDDTGNRLQQRQGFVLGFEFCHRLQDYRNISAVLSPTSCWCI